MVSAINSVTTASFDWDTTVGKRLASADLVLFVRRQYWAHRLQLRNVSYGGVPPPAIARQADRLEQFSTPIITFHQRSLTAQIATLA